MAQMDLIQRIVISNKYKFIYYETPKVATRSMLDYFVRKPKMDYNAIRHPITQLNLNKQRKFFKFGFVRNPWERVVSCYVNKICSNPLGYPYIPDKRLKHKMPFKDFVDYLYNNIQENKCDIHYRSQFTFIKNCNYIGRLENLEEDFTNIRKKLKLPIFKLRKMNPRPSEKPYKEYYNNETKKLIGIRYKKDIELFNYKW